MFCARVYQRVQEVADVQLRIKECIDIKQELSTAIQQAKELHIQVVCMVLYLDYIPVLSFGSGQSLFQGRRAKDAALHVIGCC
jgi:hypothetical protein